MTGTGKQGINPGWHGRAWRLLFGAVFAGSLAAQEPALVPVTPQPQTDRLGNEWQTDQNGLLSRQGSANTILSGSMMLMIGNEQFYCAQPMGTSDGKELVLSSQQPMQGLQVTRYIRLLEKDGGMRYLEMLTNTLSREVTVTMEIRHNFSGQVKAVLTDSGRACNGPLEKTETGVVAVPGAPGYNGFIFVASGPRSGLKPRVVCQNLYQLSFYYTLVIPAGKSAAVLHTVSQGKISSRPDTAELEKVFRPFALARQLRELPRSTAPLVMNLKPAGDGIAELAAWLPSEVLGVKREAVDVLAMGGDTRLRGRATCAKLSLQHRLGTFVVPWERVAAIAGGMYDGGEDRLYLADGQVFRGRLHAEELKLALSNGLQMMLQPAELDRLVLAAPAGPVLWPKGVSVLLETWNGERWAVREEGAALQFQLASAWGHRQVPLGELAMLSRDPGDGGPPMAVFRDGSRLRVWMGAQEGVTFTSPYLGKVALPGGQLRSMAASFAFPSTGDPSVADDGDAEPVTSFVDLAGEQRLVAPATDASWQMVTAGGPVSLDPAGIREMRNVSEEVGSAGTDDAPWFQIELWGGGNVLGQVRESTLGFAVGGEVWRIPARELLRLANPAPKLAEATLARIGKLIRELGNDQWKTREEAAGELRSMGDLARSSLRDALKHAEDVEVRRRIEHLLVDLE